MFIYHQKTGPSRSEEGVALVIVLSILVLVSMLAIGFLSRTTTERTSSQLSFESEQTQSLADQAVNIVQAQISHAASQQGPWASQPGMIRSYNQDGTLLRAYKLYSDDAMTPTTLSGTAVVAALAGWTATPAIFTDLNEPVIKTGTGTGSPNISIYPILDAKAVGGGIEGFKITNAPGASTSQPVPMPVRWLYILQDGTLVAPGASPGASSASIAGASRTNPVVGRIAFWADDESAKLNINTAAHGYFWDIPRAFSQEERDRMARYQPALREYQRYPGHPATTSLWPVFGSKFASGADPIAAFDEFIFGVENSITPGLSPRVRQGGSLRGTRTAPTPIVPLASAPRLYASVEELLFTPARAQSPLTRDDVEKSEFFLTARSQAPEINLFNQPRMAIWPINTGAKTPSSLDSLIAFCATANGAPYYFTRSNPLSTTDDYNSRNQALYNWLDTLLSTPFPGFGDKSFADKYTQAETRQIITQIFDYIRSSNLFSTSHGATAFTSGDPQVAGSQVGQVTPLLIGDTKGFGRHPILSKAVFQLFVSGATSTTGTYNATTAGSAITGGSTPLLSTAVSPVLTTFLNNTGVGNDINLETSGIVYFDSFDPHYGYIFPRYKFDVEVEFQGAWTVNGKALNFPASATINIVTDQANVYDAKEHKFRTTWMGRYLGGLLGPTWMMQNYTSLANNPNNTVGGVKRAYPLVSQRIKIHPPIALVSNAAIPPKPTLPDITTVNPGVADFSGGTVIAKLKMNGDLVQTYEFNFPAFTKPAPVYAARNHIATASGEEYVLKQFSINTDFRHRWLQQTQLNGFLTSVDYADVGLVQLHDVSVSLEPAWGDKRLIAARANLKSGSAPGGDVSFVPHKDYTDTTKRIATELRSDPFGTERRFLSVLKAQRPGRILNITYGQNAMPDIPSLYANGVSTDGNFTPDFDNGTLHMPDDAYVNRADEGSAYDLVGQATGGNDRYFAWYWDSPAAGSGAFYNTPTFFSPNKQMPSAVMFGSLPTGVVRNHPWQTLLFRPNPGNHPGAAAGFPADHLLLDLFWMPVVEPYAISEPFATNGKVNMNYQIMPFGWIQRSTAMRGVLQTQEILSLENANAYKGTADPGTGYPVYATISNPPKQDEYKMFNEGTATDISTKQFRKKLNLDETTGTLKTFEKRFADDRLFVSETEICNVPLIPVGATWSEDFETDYWTTRRLTGDNSREMPYAQLLPRLTTRSNTWTVHYRVQSLKKVLSTDPAIWDETRDKVISEKRGSRMIERYIDPADTRIPDYTLNPAAAATSSRPNLESFYRWRALNNREFAP